MTPINYGYVNINYDKTFLTDNGLTPPTTLEDLVEPEWKSRLVVLNPASSSPGLAFLISTIAYFGKTMDTTISTSGEISKIMTFW